MRFIQRILSIIHPTFERQSREWFVKCECGKQPDVWELGGVRWCAKGHRRALIKCPYCGKKFLGKFLKREHE